MRLLIGALAGVLVSFVLAAAEATAAHPPGYVNPAMTAYARATPTIRPTPTTITSGAYPVWYVRGRP